ncbi:MAG: hypothetical protein IT372_31040, partial [Polyangiaceae bacterium]|nr:hypothetical protein [Polyangiaceae bacterium]
MSDSATTSRIDELIASRGGAALSEAGIGAAQALEIAGQRPDLEPVFLARFRSRQGKSRVEEVRAYAWPSQQIGMRHLGYRLEEARLLRLEARRPVPFPARLYAAFEKDPKRLEELRLAEKAWERAIKQAPSKPGRAERDLLALQPAFKKLGGEVAMEMWIEAAATFQRVDNTTYAAKMLGNLLRLVEKDPKVEPSVLARTVLSAADDGVFNTKLYEHTWDLVAKRISVEAALGFGLRVFRRLLMSGRPLPSDFVRDLRSAAAKGKVEGFEALFDSTIVWAAGLPSFWNTARRTSSWREEKTQDHAETGLLRRRLVELWARASAPGFGAACGPIVEDARAGRAAGGEAWKAELWGRVRAVMPELSTYGRTILVESLLAAGSTSDPHGSTAPSTRADAERLLEAALAMLSRSPRSADRERVELAADAAFFRVREVAADLFWERAPALDEALRSATGDLTSFVALADLLGDVSEALGARQRAGDGAACGPIVDGARQRAGDGAACGPIVDGAREGAGQTVLGALPGLEAAWAGALAAALLRTEGPQTPEAQQAAEDEDEDDDSGSSGSMPIVALLGEAVSLLTPANAGEHLAELGPLVAARLARDLHDGRGLEAWAPVLGAIRDLGPVGVGVASAATSRFVARAAAGEAFGNAARLAHLLDEGALLEAAESRRIVDEALELLLEEVKVPHRTEKLLRPARELGEAHDLVDAVQLVDGSLSLLWAKSPKNEYDDDKYKEVAITIIAPDGAQRVAATGNCKGANQISQWATPDGLRVLTIKDRAVQMLDGQLKPVAKLMLPEEFEGYAYGREIIAGSRVAMIHQNRVALTVDPALKVLGVYEDSGYGSWAFLDAVLGGDAIVFSTTYSGIRNIFLSPEKKAPPIKLADFERPVLAARTDDGGFFLDYVTKKKGERRRIKLGQGGWERAPVEAPARAVVDCFPPDNDSWVRASHAEAIGYVDHTDPPVVHDFLGRALAVCPNAPGSCRLIDLASGVAVFEEGLAVDPSLPARIAAAPHLRAAIRPAAARGQGDPLPRALYADRAGLGAHLRAELERRGEGRAALAALGEHAGAVLEAAAAALMPALAARGAVLDALAAAGSMSGARAAIPRHAPGVRRTEVRRAVRSAFSEPLDGLAFWALDGDDPRPVVGYLVPEGGPGVRGRSAAEPRGAPER